MAKDKDNLHGEEIRDMHTGGENKYMIVNVVCKRSRQLIAGGPRMVQREGMSTPLDVVIAEMEEGKLAVREEEHSGLVKAMRKVSAEAKA